MSRMRSPQALLMAVLLLLLAAALVSAARPEPASAVQHTLSETDYVVRATRAAGVAEHAARHATDAAEVDVVERDLSSLRSLLPAREVSSFAGQRISVDNRSLLDLIEQAQALSQGAQRKKVLEAIGRRLRTASDNLDEPGSIAGDRRILGVVLAESGTNRPDVLTNLITKFATWLRETLGSRFNLSPDIDGGELLRPPQWLLITAAAIIILVTAMLMLRLVLRRVRVVAVSAPDVSNEPLLDLIAEDPFEEALAHARAGQRREAVRLLFRSLQHRLDVMRLVRYRRAQTNYEYLDSVRAANPALEAPVRAMIALFEKTTYGLKDCSVLEFERCRGDYDNVLDEAARPKDEERQ